MTAITEFDSMVLEFMTECGGTATYIQTSGEYDPSTGSVVSTTTNTTIQCILLDLTLQSNGYSVKYGTMVEAGDKEAYVRPPYKVDGSANLVVSPGDMLAFGGVTYKVVTFKEVNPNGDGPILYSFYLRR